MASLLADASPTNSQHQNACVCQQQSDAARSHGYLDYSASLRVIWQQHTLRLIYATATYVDRAKHGDAHANCVYLHMAAPELPQHWVRCLCLQAEVMQSGDTTTLSVQAGCGAT
jgi:hypothetical protein